MSKWIYDSIQEKHKRKKLEFYIEQIVEVEKSVSSLIKVEFRIKDRKIILYYQ